MKKLLSFSLILFLCSTFIFSQTKDINVDIVIETINVSDTDASWLVPVLQQKVEANVTKYTDYVIINTQKQQEIFAAQKKWESEAFAKDEDLTIGELRSVKERFNVSVVKLPNEYSLSIDLTDLVHGQKKASGTATRINIQNLYSSSGSAIDEVTITVCEKLDIPLSLTEKSYLKYGEASLTDNERKEIYAKDQVYYEDMIKKMDERIQSVSLSNIAGSEIIYEELESQKKIARERLKIAKENEKRVIEEEKRRTEYERENASRDAEVTNEINKIASSSSLKYKTLRQEKRESYSLLSQLGVIELKKKSALNIYNKVTKEKNALTNEKNKETEDKRNEIYSLSSYKQSELGQDGKPSKQALKARDFKFNKEKEKIEENYKKNISSLQKLIDEQLNGLLSEIDRDARTITSQKVNTLDNELVVTYSSYNPDLFGWPLTVTVKADDVVLYQTSSFLPYEKVTGKKPVVDFETDEDYAKYEDYLRQVDKYNSLFLRKEKVFVYEIEYFVTPFDITRPSTYRFSFKNFRFYDIASLTSLNNTLNSNNNGELVLKETQHFKQMSPSIDLSPLKEMLDVITMKRVNDKPLIEFIKNENDTDSYVLFGLYPQSVKKDNVEINDKKIKINSFTCYEGNDGFYYVKQSATPFEKDYSFDNGSGIIEGQEYYFKMEPIKWRVLSTTKKGNLLLFAENVLTSSPFSNSTSNSFEESEIATFLNNTFINEAFSSSGKTFLNPTTLDNSKESSMDNDKKLKGSDYYWQKSVHKIFLLSEKEATKKDYGFMDAFSKDKKRVKYTTDYAKATGAFSSTNIKEYNGGWYYLRSPYSYFNDRVRTVNYIGTADDYNSVDNKSGGVVPSIVITN